VRTGLGKELDQALRSLLPDLLEPAGFHPIKKPRTWQRSGHVAEQVLSIGVDGRTAREGYMEVWVDVGLTYAWEEVPTSGWVLAGRHPTQHPGRLTDYEPRWRFTSAYGLTSKPGLDEYLANVVIPALDRWLDPASLRNHYLTQGRLASSTELSAAIGDIDLARRLVPARAEWTVRRLQAGQPTQSPATAAGVLAAAEDLNVELPAADRTYLLADLAATIDRWRSWDAPLPGWVEEIETRFLR
jgi:hypothetical protein